MRKVAFRAQLAKGGLPLTPVTEDETGTLEIFNVTDSAKAGMEKARRQKPPRPLRAVGV